MKAFIFQTNSRNSRLSKYSNSRSQYAGKVKCYTLKSVQTSPNSAGNRLMLGLKDPKVDSFCEYEQRSIVTKQKRPRMESEERESRGNAHTKLKRNLLEPQTNNLNMQDRDFMVETNNIMMQNNDLNANSVMVGSDQNFKNEKSSDGMKEKENSVTLYSSETTEENSKAFMESIGSWINDLFTVPTKRACTTPKANKEEIQKSLVLEEDAEYLKSISHIKEQFRKKLKSETSVHLSTADKPFEFHFVKVLENNRKSKRRVKSMPSKNYASECVEDLNILNECDDLDHIMSPKMIRGSNLNSTAAELYIRTNEKETAPQSASSNFILGSSNLVKKKRKIAHKNRAEITKLEEYVLPSPAELSKRILLNINDQEKCLQFYKNPHLGVQEAQHYAARKSKPCQSNTRCYTTNANITDSAEKSRSKAFKTSNRHSHCFTGDASEVKGEEDVLPNKSALEFKKPSFRKVPIKNISELSFAKPKATKSSLYPQPEPIKTEPRGSSDELVKYLMKKIKVGSRPHSKKKATSVPQVLSTPKTRFMQSATNSLVMSVMAKKENDFQGIAKNRMLGDNKLMKSSFPSKELLIKYPYGNIRFDVSRALNYNKFNKSTYLLEEDKVEDDSITLGKNSYKNSRRPYEDLLKKDMKKNNDKVIKKQEVKQMLSKLDMKYVLNSPKVSQKEFKKKSVKTMLDNFEVDENRDSPNPRFLRQHELFKNNTKAAQHTTDPVPEPGEKQEDSPSTNSLSKELALVNTDVQLTLANLQEKNVVVTGQPEEITPNATAEDENKITDLLCIEENESNTKTERKSPIKPSPYRERFSKTKSQSLLKDNDSKNLLNPLPKYYSSEISNKNEAPKPREPAICPPDLRPLKSMDTLLFNRRYSTKTLTETIRKGKPGLLSGRQTRKGVLSLTNLGKDSENEKKAKEKPKTNTPKNKVMDENDIDVACGFEKIKKKPGPNCEADETSKS